MIGSDGWKIFLGHVRREWHGEGFHNRIGTAIAKDEIEPKVVHRTSLEILRLLQWPIDEVKDLKGTVDE